MACPNMETIDTVKEAQRVYVCSCDKDGDDILVFTIVIHL